MTTQNNVIEIAKVAKIARLALTEQEKEFYQNNLNEVIPWFREMLDIEIPENTTPLYSLTSEEEGENSFNDEGGAVELQEEVLFNVPERRENLILVPKVI
jgi:aspartyl/glutamyl-tRNA(Asn/Gln) amidotransferase C subunit